MDVNARTCGHGRPLSICAVCAPAMEKLLADLAYKAPEQVSGFDDDDMPKRSEDQDGQEQKDHTKG